MPTAVTAEIQARIELFAAELAELIQSSTLATVEAVFGNAPIPRGAARGGGSAGRAAAPARGRGQKRDPGELERLSEKLVQAIARQPGQRIEQIGKELGVATRELALPVKKLIASGRIKTEGQRRATTYFPAQGRSASTASASGRAKGERKQAAGRPGRPSKRAAKSAGARRAASSSARGAKKSPRRPKSASPKSASPKSASPKSASPKSASPKSASPKSEAKSAPAPKSARAEESAAGEPQGAAPAE